uniref:Uncharacterized protein n=1 Tax=Panagrolaimus sp. PS1159 TaxID=55785 RepID=A0AC35ESZ8_9BILA
MSALIYLILLLAFITDTIANSTTETLYSNSTRSSTEDPPAFTISGNPFVFSFVYSFALFVILGVFITPVIICVSSASSRD